MSIDAEAVTFVEQIAISRNVSEWLCANTRTLSFTTTKRRKLACASFDLALEHHEGMIALFAMDKVGAGLALSRPMLDSYVLGLWVSELATKEQLDKFLKNQFTFSLKGVVPKLKDVSVFTSAIVPDLERLIDEMNGFTHGNVSQLHWRSSLKGIAPHYSEELKVAMLRTASIFALLAAYEYQTLAGHTGLRDRMFAEANVRLGFAVAEASQD